MKPKTLKLINIGIPIVATTTMVAAPTSVAVVEHLNRKGIFYNQAKQLKKIAIDEFLKICNIPHATFETRQICDHLKQELHSVGYEETSDVKQVDKGLYYFEDEYRAEQADISSGNLIFEIPATKGRENTPGVVLQGHMDMVWATEDEFSDNHPHPVFGKKDGKPVIYSQDDNGYHSSLGADDGAGIAIILGLAKNPNIISHGPLRCIITADEEDGVSGASTITYDALKYDYVLNLDNELYNEVVISSAGTKQYEFHVDKINDEYIVDVDKEAAPEYTLDVSGLMGGHSAAEINKGQGSAIKLAGDIISQIASDTPSTGTFQLVSMYSDNPSNAICTDSTVNFVSSFTEPEINRIIDSVLGNFYIHYNDPNAVAICTAVEHEQRADKALNSDAAEKILEFISTFKFGPISWLDIEHKEVESSANLSEIDLNVNEGSDPYFTVTSLARSSSLERFVDIHIYFTSWADNFLAKLTTDGAEVLTLGVTSPTWEPNPNDGNFWNFATKAMKNAKVKHIVRKNQHGALELGFFCEQYREEQITPHIISFGATVENCHSISETLYLDTYLPTIQTLLYMLNRIDKVA